MKIQAFFSTFSSPVGISNTSFQSNVFVPITKSQWTGGKPQGNLQLNSQYYYVRHAGKLIKSIKIATEESSQKAFALAQKVLYAYCKENMLLRNEYRVCEDFDGEYLEVTASGVVFTCDTEDLFYVEDYLWKYIKRDNVIFTQVRANSLVENIYFHRAVTKVHGQACKVFHRDGNKLNNRKYNLSIEQQF